MIVKATTDLQIKSDLSLTDNFRMQTDKRVSCKHKQARQTLLIMFFFKQKQQILIDNNNEIHH